MRSTAGASLLLSLAVFAACIVGICTRPVGFLATVWPANAIMLGLLLRFPQSARLPGWIGAALAFCAADLLTGSPLFKTLLLNGANLAGIGAAWLVYMRLPDDMRTLRQPVSMLWLVLAVAVGSTAAGAVGSIANPVLFGGTALGGWTFWFATEFVNYLMILPVILAVRSVQPPVHASGADGVSPAGYARLLPVGALILSCGAAMAVGGPGAIAFPVPALLWCGLVYAVFPTAVLVLLFGLWSLAAISSGYLVDPALVANETALVSARLGASLIAFAPIMVACTMRARVELLDRLHAMATRDQLTGARNRHAFRDEAERVLGGAPGPLAVLMIDLDHFKSVNDRLGHSAGDEVLAAFAGRLQAALVDGDIFGRLGGEEFAVLLPDCPGARAIGVAERIRRVTAETEISLADGRAIRVTASIGVLIVPDSQGAAVDCLLSAADRLLYRAKENGRDRIEVLVEGQGEPDTRLSA